MTQTLTTVIGQTYTISYFVAGTNPNFLEVTFGGSTLSDYVEYTFNSAATSTSTVLAFSGQRIAGGEILLDDVSVTASGVPEPSSLLLLGTGMAKIIGVTRRKMSR